MNINRFIYKRRTILRHKLEKYPKIQRSVTSLYLKYCSLFGSSHVLPDFYILGFVKCGTTSLYEYLISHPNVHPPKGKEIDYFDRLYSRGINWYRMGFPLKFYRFIMTKIFRRIFLTGEATPRYIENPHAPQRIKQVTPHAKFIILLRNPITRAFSQHNMNLKNDYEYRNFEDSLNHETERIEGRLQKMENDPSYYSWNYDLYGYKEHGIYVDKIKHWMEVFPKEQFLIIQSEEFFSDPSKIYNQVLDFLGVENFELDTYRTYGKVNKNRKIDSIFYNELLDYFKPHNQRLYEFLGRKFDWDE